MVPVRWIKMSLFLILMLQFTAAEQRSSFTVRVGDDAALPCGNNQHNCDSTTWIFSNNMGTIRLFEHGQIHREAATKSDRLSVAENCSLVIKKVTDEDVGLYTRRQFVSGQQQGPDSKVYLSVITIYEQKNKDKVTLFCSVLDDGNCKHTVEWLYECKSSGMVISARSCSATLTFTPSHLSQNSDLKKFLKCKVTDVYTKKMQLFPFIPQSSGEKTDKRFTTSTQSITITKKSETPKTSTSSKNYINSSISVDSHTNNNPSQQAGSSWLFIIVSVSSAALLITPVMIIIIWKKTKGSKKKKEENTELSLNPAVTHSGPESRQADPEDGVLYASISFMDQTRQREQVSDTVTYSTVKASSSSTGASIDPNSLYSTVNKPKKLKVTS
ncbi:uncharacterized protein LOC121633261 [Melanotaenia boesemani]|uniref:uncharacterized protein LOC121633261 n=1 Tax=Melanotaenia boesemani TaxID=1250792 RepID=UPI001C0583AF|nr:uncharacterized protein LOC121633261 [Melanotaenia boesemani]